MADLRRIIRLAYIGDPTPVAGADIEYIGWAEPGVNSPPDKPVWRIAKLFYDANANLTKLLYANGNYDYVNIWDNRTSLSYS